MSGKTTAVHIPTSVVLEQLLAKAPADFITLDWLIEALRERSFGIVMLVMALIGLVPGASTFMGVLLVFPAVQMILAHQGPALPRFVATWRIPAARFASLCRRAIATLKHMERFIRPRWRTPFQTTKRVVGLVVLLLGPTLIWPFPFSHIIPALVIMLVSLAYLEEDGVLLLIALVAAVISLAITGATIWAGIRVTDLLTPLFGG